MSTPDTPTRASASKGKDADTELLQSLNQLSLTSPYPPAAPTAPARSSPRPSFGSSYRPPAVDRSPSSLSVRGAPRSPLNGGNYSNGRESRSASRAGTPTLLRKASMNSLNGVGAASRQRTSSANMSPSPRVFEVADRPPPPSATDVAKKHFLAELELHHSENSNLTAETVVILHDACYGHRYSRPKTSKAALSTIVERPERIRACVLGVASAYVRLGERHVEGMYPLQPGLDPASIPSIPFRIHKTSRRLPLMSPTVTNVHGTKWMEELKMMCDSAEAKLAMNGKELQRPEMNRGPDSEQPKKLHEGDLYLCEESLEALEGSLGAVCEAVDTVFKDQGPKRAFVAVRPPGHHCSASYPSGFCWVNNVHVGIMHATLGHGLTHAAIIDFDLHHGDGSQAITWEHNSRGVGLAKNAAFWKKTSIGYFSLHDINSYPCEMGDEEKVKNACLCIDNAHGQTIWNVHLESWETEDDFWRLYESKYSVLLEKARSYLKAQTQRLRLAGQGAKAAIFFSAGFDASEWEGAGMQRHSVNVPTSFYARIARDVTKIAAEEGTSVDGRVISVLEGGYSDRALTSGVLSHISGLAGSDPIITEGAVHHGLGSEIAQKMGVVRDRRQSLDLKLMAHPYDPSWWSATEMEMLENGFVASPVLAKAPRNFTPPTYSSPTAASTNKMTPTARLRRQKSGMNDGQPLWRPLTPPPPDVPWNDAAQGLCKVLVPKDRTTTSCGPEDLSAEATRARRDRQAVLTGIGLDGPTSAPAPAAAVPAPAPSRMSLRERKPAKPVVEDYSDKLDKNRRKTTGGAAVLPIDTNPSRGATPLPNGRPKQPTRRLSATSMATSEMSDITKPFSASTTDRSETSMSVRPESSMSVRTMAGGPLAVKKTRTANPAKKDATKAPRAKKPTTASVKNPSRPTSPSKASVAKSSDDMDKLTSGMKKIKINLVTKAQKEAREHEAKQKADAASQGSRVELPPPKPSVADHEAQQVPLPPSSAPVTPGLKLPPVYEAQQIPLPSSSGANTPLTTPPQMPIATPDVFISYQPEGPAPTALPQQEPQSLKWLPPNTSSTPSPMKQPDPPMASTPSPMKRSDPPVAATPSPLKYSDPYAELTPTPAKSDEGRSHSSTPHPMKRNELPIFTSTSALRFAHSAPKSSPVAPEEPAAKAMKKADEDIWEVPETPEKY